MLRKRFLSLTCALVLCLSLLPVTALAEGTAPQTLYVGSTTISAGYWTSSDGGTTWARQENQPEGNNYIYYDGQGTLKLHNATIQRGSITGSAPFGSGIYALSSSNQPVALTIELIGKNTITGNYGIYVDAQQGGTVGTNASLLIQNSDDDGSLEVSGSSYGIYVKSGTGNASLTIKDASVVASCCSSYGSYAGVCVHSGSDATSSPKLSLAVDGGSLTTSASKGNDGIQFYVGANGVTSETTSLSVTNNAIVDARNGGIRASGVSVNPNVNIGSTDSTSGIVFDGTEGTVYGNVELQKDLEIKSGETLTIPEGSTLNTNNNLTNNGTIVNTGGTLNGEPDGTGKIETTPTIDTQPENQTVTAGNTATFTVDANGENLSYQWQQKTTDSGSDWTNVGSATSSNTYTIDNTTTSMSGYQYRCVVNNSAGSVTSNAVTLTVNAATVPVTGVSLTPASLSLFTGDTATLTATVQPSNATNQNVTWSSDKPDVATVDAAGKVTAVGAGTATITVTTADGSKQATCSVTVTRPYIPPANPNYKITVEATQGGTVTADPTAAKAGTTVTLTPVPDRGYQVGTVAVTDRFGEPVAVTEQADGTYTFTMPSGQVKVEVTFVESQPEPLPFTDVKEGDWFHDAVRYVYDNGLMDGVGDGQFAPNATTNRAMVVTILYRLAGEPDVSGDVSFTDVEPGLWYTDAVLWAAQKGIVNGISETEFAPSGDLTREQLATVLYRYAESMGYDVSAQADLSGFPDAGDIQDYATEALSWAVAEGLLQGFEDDSLQPGGTATRAQIATILMRFLAAVSAE
ncbi:S-layer homology domain-containing protein [Evtepia sp.]|uniref:S-layer homology domain-containing protein n=1 Tax=Evtepia sp. TaxID=2773933 RepID=UPI00399AECB3